VANTLAELIIGGALTFMDVPSQAI